MIKVLCITKLPEDKQKEMMSIPGYEFFFNLEDVNPADIEVVVGNPSKEMVEKMTNLKWIQLNSAGANTYSYLPDTIQLTNASGAYGEAISEHMIGYALMVQKNLARYLFQQQSHAWKSLGNVATLSESTVLSVGVGDIGSTFAKKMNLLGARVIGVTRNEHDCPEYVEKVVTMKDLDAVLPEADIVALSLPETEETIHMFDYDRLKKMKKNAILINVGRGSAIKSDDLIKVMKEKHLSGVCLDVTEYEPLPQNHALWTCENVYITPHISGGFSARLTLEKVFQIIITNLKHYQANETLEHLVNKKIGY